MHGLNQSDYAARHYDPAYIRFTTMDPMAEKYYSISPYVYVANNPIKFIDPDGKDIVILVNKKEFTYNGKGLLNSQGQDTPIPKGSHIERIVNGYNFLRNSGDPVLAGKVQHLMNSNNKHYINGAPSQYKSTTQAGSNIINKTTVSEDESKIDAGVGIGTTTRFLFGEKEEIKKGNVFSDAEIVAHEMQHQFDYDIGNMKDGHYLPSSATNPAEIRAVNTQNRVNKLEGKELVTKYKGVEIDPKKLEK